MSEPFLITERTGAVVLARFNRPDSYNAISGPEEAEAVADFARAMMRDRSVRAIVLTGSGKAFCAGGNVKLMRDRAGPFGGSPYDIRHAYRTSFQLIGAALHDLEVPIIAAINGPAVGLGLNIACFCDIRIASDRATMAESYVKIGLVPGGGGGWILPRLIGPQRAALMTLTGAPIDAAKALEYGLVAEVVPHDSLLDRACELAHQIAANPGHATRLAKRLLREGGETGLSTYMELAAAFQAAAHHTEDHIEAVSALLEKREATFTDS